MSFLFNQKPLGTSNSNSQTMSLNQDENAFSDNKISAEKLNIDLDFSKLIENLFSFLLFLLPVFFLPITADALSVNKSFLVILIGFIVFALFLASSLSRKRLFSYDFKSYLGMIALVVAAGLSTYFSLNKNVSMFGSFGNYADSFIYIFALALIGYTASNIKLNLNKLLGFLVAGVTLSTLVSLIGYYGVTLPLLGLGENAPRVFSLAGSIYVLFGLQILAVIVAILTY